MLALILKYKFDALRGNCQMVIERFIFQNPV